MFGRNRLIPKLEILLRRSFLTTQVFIETTQLGSAAEDVSLGPLNSQPVYNISPAIKSTSSPNKELFPRPPVHSAVLSRNHLTVIHGRRDTWPAVQSMMSARSAITSSNVCKSAHYDLAAGQS